MPEEQTMNASKYTSSLVHILSTRRSEDRDRMINAVSRRHNRPVTRVVADLKWLQDRRRRDAWDEWFDRNREKASPYLIAANL